MKAFFDCLRNCIEISQVAEKCQTVERLWKQVDASSEYFNALLVLPAATVLAISAPGRPAKPELVAPAAVPRRRLGSATGRASLVHAIAHIEFNAINLALDAAYRFRDFPKQYYLDWLSVAFDEVRHFRLLQQRLIEMGYEYGDFSAHNGLWEMAVKTARDPLVRMALVPRVLEARGLDVTPGMIQRLRNAGDLQTVAVLELILVEEVRHVAIGSHWYRWCCEQRSLEPDSTFKQLLEEYYGRLKGPFNLEARSQAGFSATEIKNLKALM